MAWTLEQSVQCFANTMTNLIGPLIQLQHQQQPQRAQILHALAEARGIRELQGKGVWTGEKAVLACSSFHQSGGQRRCGHI